MPRHAEATTGDEAARRWLLDYNRGDVEASLAVREWIRGTTSQVPNT